MLLGVVLTACVSKIEETIGGMHLLSSMCFLSVYEVASTRGAPFAYPALARYRAAVYFPWDYGMLLFSELYNVGVPCWIPAVGWQTHLMQRMIRSHS